MSDPSAKSQWSRIADPEHKYSGVYSLDPLHGRVAYDNDHYLRDPKQIEGPHTIKIILGPEYTEARKKVCDERSDSIRQFLTEEGIAFEAKDDEGRHTTTIADKGSIGKLYGLVLDLMSGERPVDRPEGHHLESPYLGIALYEAIFGRLMVHPADRAFNMGDRDAQKQLGEGLRKIFAEQGPERAAHAFQQLSCMAEVMHNMAMGRGTGAMSVWGQGH